MCKTDSQWASALWHREFNPGLCDNLEGGEGWEVGGRFKREGTYVCGWFLLMYGRNQNNIVKQRSSKKIFKKRERVSQERGRGKNPQMQERREENPQSDGERETLDDSCPGQQPAQFGAGQKLEDISLKEKLTEWLMWLSIQRIVSHTVGGL